MKTCITCLLLLQRHPESGKIWMHFIDNIIINQMSFNTTPHNRCIHIKAIDGEVIYLLKMEDDCLLSSKNEQTARNF